MRPYAFAALAILAATPTHSATIEGIVFDQTSGTTASSNVHVTLYKNDNGYWHEIRYTYTDKTGGFSFKEQEVGSYALHFEGEDSNWRPYYSEFFDNIPETDWNSISRATPIAVESDSSVVEVSVYLEKPPIHLWTNTHTINIPPEGGTATASVYIENVSGSTQSLTGWMVMSGDSAWPSTIDYQTQPSPLKQFELRAGAVVKVPVKVKLPSHAADTWHTADIFIGDSTNAPYHAYGSVAISVYKGSEDDFAATRGTHGEQSEDRREAPMRVPVVVME